MALADAVLIPTQRQRVRLVQWSLTNADPTGIAVDITAWQDRTVHVFGANFDSGTVVIQGSNDPRAISDPSNASWITLRDPAGNNLSFTAAGLRAVLELPRYVRPSCSGQGGSAAITVIINARGDTV